MMAPMWQMALQDVLIRWSGTPWVAGQQCLGRGVDCVRFVTAVLDELHHLTLPAPARLPQDMSLHDRTGAMRVARAIEQRYPHVLISDPHAIEPGDVVIVRTAAGSGPGHVLIAGAGRGELWHAVSGAGVVKTSLAALMGCQVVRIWRPTEREQWGTL